MMKHHTTPPEPTPAPAPKLSRWRHFDVLSGLSFFTGGVISLGRIANNIQTKFYQNFVLGYGEAPTPFRDIVETYLGDKHLGMENTKGKFAEAAIEFEKVRAAKDTMPADAFREKAAAFITHQKDLTKEYRGKINERLLGEFGIKNTSFHRWTDGALKLRGLLGDSARKETGYAIAAVGSVALGTAFLLHSQKRSLDAIDDKLDTLKPATTARAS